MIVYTLKRQGIKLKEIYSNLYPHLSYSYSVSVVVPTGLLQRLIVLATFSEFLTKLFNKPTVLGCSYFVVHLALVMKNEIIE